MSVAVNADLRDLEEVLSYIRENLGEGVVGVQGFSMTIRRAKGSMNLAWGDLAIRRRRAPSSPTPEPKGSDSLETQG